MKNAPPASTAVPSTESGTVQQKIELEEEKDVVEDPKEPSFPEEERKVEEKEEETAVTKPCEFSNFFFWYIHVSKRKGK